MTWWAWLWLVACASPVDKETPSSEDFQLQLPDHFPSPAVPDDNPLSQAKIELGRHLFHDTRLSINGKRSCGICHEQPKGFTDGFVRTVGATNEIHTLNTLSLINVAYRQELGWRSPDVFLLEEHLTGPLFKTAPLEMGMTEELVLERIADAEWYAPLLAAAYGEQELNFQQIAQALASYQRTLIGGTSDYDRFLQGDDDALDASQKRGLQLFQGRLQCSRCHGGLFLDSPSDANGVVLERHGYANTGLYNLDGDGAYPPAETGLMMYTGEPQDMGKFRIPSLRNVAVTGPWLHDGSGASLEDVLDVYARGGRRVATPPNTGDGRDSPLKDDLITGFGWSEGEKNDVLRFLSALTDERILSADQFSSPFCREEDGIVINEPCIIPYEQE